MDITYDYYRVFYYVAKYKSFSKAAKALFSNQPNVSRIMNNLENQLGCRLLVRSNKGVSLTPEGQKLFKHVTIAYNHLQAAESELAGDMSLENGVVTIGATDAALHLLLLPVLQQFRKQYPGVHIRILNHASLQAIRSVRDGIADFAVVTSPVTLKNPQKETVLFSFSDILVGSREYAFLSDTPHTLEEIKKYPLISLEQSTTNYAFFRQFYLRNGFTMEPDTEASSLDQLLPLIENDLGLGYVPKKLAIPYLERGRFFNIPLTEQIPPRHVSIIEDCGHPLSISANAMKKMLLSCSERLKKNEPPLWE